VLHPAFWSHVSDLAIDFVSKLVIVDENQRMSIDDALRHPFISRHNSNSIKITLAPIAHKNKLSSLSSIDSDTTRYSNSSIPKKISKTKEFLKRFIYKN
jgi:serine/threonine protein kinase